MQSVLIAAAVVPAVWLLIKIYRADRLEREPLGLIVSLVLLGIVSTTFAAMSEQLGETVLSAFYPEGSRPYDLILYFGIVALSEELFKYLLLRLRTWRSPDFNCLFDGVVYAVSVSLGFALWENISYVLQFGMGVAFARALTAVPGHACFGVFMGAWYGAAKKRELAGKPGHSARCRWMAVLVPVLLHGSYDFIASQQSEEMGGIFVGFVALMFFIAYRLVVHISKHDSYMNPRWDIF